MDIETGYTTQLKPAITIFSVIYRQVLNWIRAGAFSILKDIEQGIFIYLIVGYYLKTGIMKSNMKFVSIHINFLSEEGDVHWEKEKKKKGRRKSDVIKEKHQQCINPGNRVERMELLSRGMGESQVSHQNTSWLWVNYPTPLFKIQEDAQIAKWIIKCKIWKVALFYILLGLSLVKSVLSFAFRKESQKIIKCA